MGKMWNELLYEIISPLIIRSTFLEVYPHADKQNEIVSSNDIFHDSSACRKRVAEGKRIIFL